MTFFKNLLQYSLILAFCYHNSEKISLTDYLFYLWEKYFPFCQYFANSAWRYKEEIVNIFFFYLLRGWSLLNRLFILSHLFISRSSSFLIHLRIWAKPKKLRSFSTSDFEFCPLFGRLRSWNYLDFLSLLWSPLSKNLCLFLRTCVHKTQWLRLWHFSLIRNSEVLQLLLRFVLRICGNFLLIIILSSFNELINLVNLKFVRVSRF